MRECDGGEGVDVKENVGGGVLAVGEARGVGMGKGVGWGVAGRGVGCARAVCLARRCSQAQILGRFCFRMSHG